MTEKEARKKADLDKQEQTTLGMSMCEICLELTSVSIRFTNNLNFMRPTTNICKGCLKKKKKKCDKQ